MMLHVSHVLSHTITLCDIRQQHHTPSVHLQFVCYRENFTRRDMNSSLFSHLVANDTTNKKNKLHCVDGMLLPVWNPLEDVSQVEIAIRGIIYLISMFYLFVGVSILVDKL